MTYLWFFFVELVFSGVGNFEEYTSNLGFRCSMWTDDLFVSYYQCHDPIYSVVTICDDEMTTVLELFNLGGRITDIAPTLDELFVE
jgi:hypothetical protein